MAIATRPLIPIDETRYASVAWEMHTSGDFLVPHLNGQLYSHKPPLFFWLMNGMWSIFGLGAWPARVVGPLFGLSTVGLAYYAARLMWPEQRQLAGSAALLIVSGVVWSVFTSLTMFDTGLSFFVMLFCIGLLKLASGARLTGVLVLGLALGGGLLQKGPAVFLHTIPTALLAPWWVDRKTFSIRWRNWYLAIAGAVAVGGLIVFSWVLPAIGRGGADYAEAILWKQSAGRVVKSFAHGRPFWWYLPIIPLLIFPWSFAWPAWRNLHSVWGESAVRLCSLSCITPCVAFSMLSGKQIHYLLPIVPIMALLMVRLLSTMELAHVRQLNRYIAGFLALCAVATLSLPILARQIIVLQPLVVMTPVWMGILAIAAVTVAMTRVTDVGDVIRRVTVYSLLAWIVISGMVNASIRDLIDLRQFASDVARHQQSDRPVAYVGNYHGQFNFLGQLESPIVELSTAQVPNWVEANPQGYVIMERDATRSTTLGLLACREELLGTRVRRLELWEARYAPLADASLADRRAVGVSR